VSELIAQARALLAEGRAREAEELFERAVGEAPSLERAQVASRAGTAARKAGQPRIAARWYRRAQELAPRDPEHPHDRGLALLEAGDVGLAAQAQAEALALDADHTGARAQRAAALEALGDDEGAAAELDQLLLRLGPQPALTARGLGLREAARRASARRLVGNAAARLAASPVVGTALARSLEGPLSYRAPFAELRGAADGGRLWRLELVFDSMDASLARSDLAYGGSTEDEDGRRVPLDEFTSASVVFLAESLGIEPLRARRLLQWLLTPECGAGPHRFAGARVGWVIESGDGERRYGLFVEAAAARLVA
jgi:tetratricopeptide (TPR) repeat protein